MVIVGVRWDLWISLELFNLRSCFALKHVDLRGTPALLRCRSPCVRKAATTLQQSGSDSANSVMLHNDIINTPNVLCFSLNRNENLLAFQGKNFFWWAGFFPPLSVYVLRCHWRFDVFPLLPSQLHLDEVMKKMKDRRVPAGVRGSSQKPFHHELIYPSWWCVCACMCVTAWVVAFDFIVLLEL